MAQNQPTAGAWKSKDETFGAILHLTVLYANTALLAPLLAAGDSVSDPKCQTAVRPSKHTNRPIQIDAHLAPLP